MTEFMDKYRESGGVRCSEFVRPLRSGCYGPVKPLPAGTSSVSAWQDGSKDRGGWGLGATKGEEEKEGDERMKCSCVRGEGGGWPLCDKGVKEKPIDTGNPMCHWPLMGDRTDPCMLDPGVTDAGKHGNPSSTASPTARM